MKCQPVLCVLNVHAKKVGNIFFIRDKGYMYGHISIWTRNPQAAFVL